MEDKDILETIREIRCMQDQILLLLEHLHGRLNLETAWLDNNDLCRLLKVTDKTLYRWRQSGKLAYAMVGGKFYYSKQNIDKLIATQGIK
ncbi:helix-turn-helix domain-containing protein [Pedobacter sp. GR22-10]|uniref:helix-turn-helix domain-containing protein n=1 Tax=Pedobacter sp. GR22-10 TaxID=2994472 RepID=UPI00224642C5|nr:helix-turn-helix domain-containing protein [Pedobacter sp. GR22-10]MCX2430165.1 helix-turn-helix domain-containing protein [Pedobacter sp. GR22-10]